jgi:hypothetical protein
MVGAALAAATVVVAEDLRRAGTEERTTPINNENKHLQ